MFNTLLIVASLITILFAQPANINSNNVKVGPVNLTTPNLNKVIEYTKYAASTLCPAEKLINWSCKSCSVEGNLTNIRSFNHYSYGTFGYVGTNHKTKAIIVSFRDTVNLQNIVQDLILVPQPLGYRGTEGMFVHAGFYAATKSVFPRISSIVESYFKHFPKYKVIIVGHSLGGAIASISTVLLHHELKIPFHQMELYTYGQPRTGNPAFANYLNRQNMVIARVAKEGDPITLAVPRNSMYAHHHNEIFLPHGDRKQPTYCSQSQLEDPNCSSRDKMQLSLIARHYNYFGISFQPDSCK